MRTSKSTHYPVVRITGVGQGPFPIGTSYVELGGVDDLVQSVHIAWPDAVSSATITLESSNFNPIDVAPSAGDAFARSTEADGYRWCVEPAAAITGPGGTAAGSFMLHIGNTGARRLRLKIVAAAATQLYIIGHGKQ